MCTYYPLLLTILSQEKIKWINCDKIRYKRNKKTIHNDNMILVKGYFKWNTKEALFMKQ